MTNILEFPQGPKKKELQPQSDGRLGTVVALEGELYLQTPQGEWTKSIGNGEWAKLPQDEQRRITNLRALQTVDVANAAVAMENQLLDDKALLEKDWDNLTPAEKDRRMALKHEELRNTPETGESKWLREY